MGVWSVAREKFRVNKDIGKAKNIVCVGQTEVQDMKRAAKRKYRRRVNQSLKQADAETGDDVDILGHKQELTGWDIS